jgi:glutamate racemase
MNHDAPIGIFDSGLGGLTVLKTLCDQFPKENFLYLGDLARLPYGNKSPETIRRYGEQILKRMKEEKVKMLIIACNTASTVFLGEKNFEGIPLWNVIEPGAEAALRMSKTKKIAVLGTATTVSTGAYTKVLKSLDSSVTVTEKACPLFVPLAEEGWSHDPVTIAVAEKYLKDIKGQVDTTILGCTHYPILKDDLQKVLGSEVKLVESGDVLAEKLKDQLKCNQTSRKIRLWTTDITPHFQKLAEDLMVPHQLAQLERIVL